MRFELNGNIYETDNETLELLRTLVPRAKKTGDSTAVIAVIELGKVTGRVREVKRSRK